MHSIDSCSPGEQKNSSAQWRDASASQCTTAGAVPQLLAGIICQKKQSDSELVVTPDGSALSHKLAKGMPGLLGTSQLPSANEVIELPVDVNIANGQTLHGLILHTCVVFHDRLLIECAELPRTLPNDIRTGGYHTTHVFPILDLAEDVINDHSKFPKPALHAVFCFLQHSVQGAFYSLVKGCGDVFSHASLVQDVLLVREDRITENRKRFWHRA